MKFYQPIKKNFECVWIVTLNVLLEQAWYRDKVEELRIAFLFPFNDDCISDAAGIKIMHTITG